MEEADEKEKAAPAVKSDCAIPTSAKTSATFLSRFWGQLRAFTSTLENQNISTGCDGRQFASPVDGRMPGHIQDLFACRQCHAIYAITRLRQPPISAPSCMNCGNKFPPSELGDWLAYERVESESIVDEWGEKPFTKPEESAAS